MSRNVTPDCPICLDMRRLAVVLPNGERALDSNGQLLYRDCDCEIRRKAERRARELRDASGVSTAVFERLTFAAFDPAAAVDARCDMAGIKRACEAFAADPGGWLVLAGSYGTGKTHLAYAVAGALLRRGVPVYAASVPEMLGMIRAGITDTQGYTVGQRLNALRSVQVLVLDDWGVQKATDWADEQLFVVLNTRYNDRLATLITTNLRPEELTRRDPRLASRLLDKRLSTVRVLVAGDYRQRR